MSSGYIVYIMLSVGGDRQRSICSMQLSMSDDTPRHDSRLTLAVLVGGMFVGTALALRGLAPTPDVVLDDASFAVVNGQQLSHQVFQRAVEALQRERGKPLDAHERSRIAERLIDEELMVAYGISLGVARSDGEIRGKIVAAVLDLERSRAESEPITDEQLKQYFADHRDDFAGTPLYRAEGIWIAGPPARSYAQAKRRAEQCRGLILNGDTFSAVNARLGDQLPLPVPRGTVPLSEFETVFGPSVARVLSSLSVGTVSDAIASGGGFRVVRLNERVGGQSPKFEDIKELLKGELIRQRAESAVENLIAQLKQTAAIQLRHTDRP